MHYGIIYSVDTDADCINNDEFQPVPQANWSKTEDEPSEYECFEGTKAGNGVVNMDEGSGWHRKWCACLNQKQMDKFMAKMEFTTTCPTMGSIGAPQPDGTCSFGLSPAFAVETSCEYAMCQAFVTPYLIPEEDDNTIPELDLASRDGPHELREEDWDIIVAWFEKKYDLD